MRDHFTVDLLEIVEPVDCVSGCNGVLIVLEGEGAFGDIAVRAGQVAVITADTTRARNPEREIKNTPRKMRLGSLTEAKFVSAFKRSSATPANHGSTVPTSEWITHRSRTSRTIKLRLQSFVRFCHPLHQGTASGGFKNDAQSPS